MNKLLIVGTVAFDKIQTPFGKTNTILGGAATYIGISASHFNVNAGIVSVVGGDFPKAYFKILEDKKINTQGIEIVKNGKTFFWSGKYHNDMNSRDTLETQLNVLENFDPKVPDFYKDSDMLMLGNLHPLIQNKVLKQMTKKPKLVVLDTMDFWMNVAMEDLKKNLKKIDVITINDQESRQLSGEFSLVKAARKISQMGPKYVIIKKGEHGALLFQKENVFFSPALPLEDVFDPTGAGDTFAGGFTGYLTQMGDISFEMMKNAVIYGCNMSSFCVEEFGTSRLQNLKYSEVLERLKTFQKLTQYEMQLN